MNSTKKDHVRLDELESDLLISPGIKQNQTKVKCECRGSRNGERVRKFSTFTRRPRHPTFEDRKHQQDL